MGALQMMVISGLLSIPSRSHDFEVHLDRFRRRHEVEQASVGAARVGDTRQRSNDKYHLNFILTYTILAVVLTKHFWAPPL